MINHVTKLFMGYGFKYLSQQAVITQLQLSNCFSAILLRCILEHLIIGDLNQYPH